MAGLLTSDITTFLQKVYPDTVVESAERKKALFSLLGSKSQAGGDAIKWGINYSGNSSAASFAEGDSEPVAGKQSYKEASLAFRGNWVIFRISRKAINAAGGNVALIKDLISGELARGTKDYINSFEAQLMSDGAGNGGKDIDGMAVGVSDSGTYAGIDRGVYTWFKSVKTNVAGALARSHIQTLFRTLRTPPRKGVPNAALVGATVFDIVGDILDGGSTASIQQREMGLGLKFEGGYTHLWYKGVPIIEIPGYTAQRLDLINVNDFEHVFLRDFSVDPEQIDGDDITFKVTAWSNMKSADPYNQGCLYGITG